MCHMSKFSLKYFHEQLKIHEFAKIKTHKKFSARLYGYQDDYEFKYLFSEHLNILKSNSGGV